LKEGLSSGGPPDFRRRPRSKKYRLPGHQVPDETLMKQYPFPCENVVKQIAGINDLEQTTGGDS